MTWQELFEDHLYYTILLAVSAPVCFGVGLVLGGIWILISGL
jgi:hypothetical protein